ncbi:MAG TPA: UvrD-helicase domain-containing protein [candidate division Zixibacteria bacterium]|nr:UvrD-helicase domain-containing protein [candidate division Zixibacteria bacterium]
MTPPKATPPPDQDQRERAIAERDRNVIIDAGAGTGKTTILVDRLVEMVAPRCGPRPLPISRIAAITFTRKAAGELRLRIRERLLEELSKAEPGTGREVRLRDAIADLDTAYVGTIHSFADRLLRLRPVEAELSPSYEIVEDEQPLIQETFDVLMQAVESGTLAAELAGTDAADRAAEAAQTVLEALDAGIRAESLESEWQVRCGLDQLIAGFIRFRDVPPPKTAPPPFDFRSFRKAAGEFVSLAKSVGGGSPGADWIAQTRRTLARLRDAEDPAQIFREVRYQLERGPRNPVTKRDTFGGDNGAWEVWKTYIGRDNRRPRPLRDELCAPFYRWLATRLACLFPVVVALYEKVKARRRRLDQIDLLLKLRNLLARDLSIRGEYQRLFDHVFIDEFQDTDPLQAEIVLYLCEREPRAGRWEDVVLADGKLTLVGDPKQSIYRFRRADIAVYERVRKVVAGRDHLGVTLSASFRSVPTLVDWLNDRFTRILGTSPDGSPFDPASGAVFHRQLAHGRRSEAERPVHVLRFEFRDRTHRGADDYRALEARALARYLRWLVECSDLAIVDSIDTRPRRIRYGDIAILAVSTWRLPLLFPRLDDEGIPYTSRGGTLFLEDPIHRQFLLGLRALADRDDGVAEAALLRPPFFAVDLAELLQERILEDGAGGPGQARAGRASAARELVRDLRQRRFDRPPGATACDLLDRTAFARTIARGPNGAQRLARLRELCHLIEKIAADEGLDYDAATARAREWIDNPVSLDPPRAVGTEAVQVLTVHQAKGLEFPVVAIWDGKGQWRTLLHSSPWRMERDGRGWMINLDGLAWEEPAGLGIRDTEQSYLDAERKRVVYVAATRARDLLIVPRAGEVSRGRHICADLLADAPERLVRIADAYVDGAPAPDWARQLKPATRVSPGDGAALERRVEEQWGAFAKDAARPRFLPTSVSALARAPSGPDAEDALGTSARKERAGRFGGLFGSVVHHAIGLLLRQKKLDAREAVERAASLYGLTEHLEEAVADVTRALEALAAAGLHGLPEGCLCLEYPIAGQWEEGRLATGFIDLIAVDDRRLTVIDFKTDLPPSGPIEESYPHYAAQVRAYGKLLGIAGLLVGRGLRCGLLFTADGAIRWLES